MKKNFFKLASLATTACFACVLTFVFQSCQSEDEKEFQESEIVSPFIKDLQKLENAQRLFCQKLVGTGTRAQNGSLGVAPFTEELKVVAEQVISVVNEIKQSHDLTADLNEHQKEGFLNLDEETLELLSLDRDALMEYFQEYKSEEFVKMVSQHSPKNPFSVKEILSNENLKMNEQLCLLSVAVVEEYFDKGTATDFGNQISVQQCADNYANSIESCWEDFVLTFGSAIGILPLNIKDFRAGPAFSPFVAYKAIEKLSLCRKDAKSTLNYCLELANK